jgi:hypothetical protein
MLKGVQILEEYIGDVEVERCIDLIQRKAFDYKIWRQGLDDDLSIEEITQNAIALRNKSSEWSN